ncbi:MAG: bacteriohemerythrin [Ignavibacteria bacterium]|nr:bacteriohemerythrin [Ignavibacteria bacterium]
MPLINWADSMSVGIPEIDDQHKKLIDLTNLFYAAMNAGKSREVTGHIIAELVAYTEYHFSAEEQLMESRSYPGLEEHKKEHLKLTLQVKDLYVRHEKGNLIISMEIMNFLRDWLNNHIKESDRQYQRYFSRSGA